MLKNEFDPKENLFRSIKEDQNLWDYEKDSFSSATFKDSGGCSVDRQGTREFEASFNALLNRKPKSKAIIHLTVEKCHECSAKTKYDPIKEENLFHSLILDSSGSFPIKSSLAKKLQRASQICFKK